MTHVSSVEPSHFDSSTIYVAFDNHRRNDFKPYLFVSTRFRKDVPVDRVEPAERPRRTASTSIREDPRQSRTCLYVGTETRRIRVARTRGRAGSSFRATCRPFRSTISRFIRAITS